jgi:hypothetical protein
VEWLTAALFPGKSDRTRNISYETQAEELKRLLKKLGLRYSKLTHVFRNGGARHLDSAGMDDSVSTASHSQPASRPASQPASQTSWPPTASTFFVAQHTVVPTAGGLWSQAILRNVHNADLAT